MLPAQQFSVHWLDSRLGWGIPLCHHSQTGERNGGGWLLPLSVFFFNPWLPWLRMIAMVAMIAPATHEPVVVVTDWSVPDRCIEGIGSVIRRWGCYQSLWWRVTLLRKLLYCVFFNELQGSIWINPATSFSPKAFSLCCTMSDGVQYKKNFSLCSDNRFHRKPFPYLITILSLL